MRILIADKLSDAARAQLESEGFDVVFDPAMNGDSLTEALHTHNPDALIVRSTKVQTEQLEATASLQLVVRAGAGVNTIALDVASARGIFVANCPGMNAAAVAELAFGHILDADRAIIRLGRVPGPFLQVEGLVDRPVQVEHEMNREVSLILKHLEALPGGAASVVVEHEQVDTIPQPLESPTVGPDLLPRHLRQVPPKRVIVRLSLVLIEHLRIHLVRKSRLRPVGVVPSRIVPEHDRRAGVE